MDDNTDIAFLAASMERQMRTSLAGSQGLSHNKTDFRRFLTTNPDPRGQQQYQQPPQYYNQPPPQYHQAPQHNNYNVPPDNYIPEGVLPPSESRLIQLPPGYGGPNNVGPTPNNFPQQFQTSLEEVNNFNVPSYNKQYLEDEQEFRDALIKEIKSQKTTIKKLNREIDALIIAVNNLTTLLQPILSPSSPILTPSEITPDANPVES